jgi:beta-xylosidase
VHWQAHGPILNIDELSWTSDDQWAWGPGVIEKNGTYYMYFSAGAGDPSAIGVATSSSPAGPFVDARGSALLVDNGDFHAIGPMPFKDPVSGKTYLYAGGLSDGRTLHIYELNNDMISIAQQVSTSTPPNYAESPFMHYRDGIYYLSYSVGDGTHSENYAVHYATSTTPYGPWTYHGEILASEGWFKGPGSHSFLYNAAMDEWYIFYLRWNERFDLGPYYGRRSICVDRLEHKDNRLLKPIFQTDKAIGPVWLGNSLLGDFTGDNVVDYEDLRYFCQVWLSSDTKADIQPIGGNNIVDILDFTVFTNQW